MQMNYTTKEQRILVTTVALETFFNIFVTKKCVEGDAKVASELDEALQVAEDLFELWSNPLPSYLGRCQNLELITDKWTTNGFSYEGVEEEKAV